MKFNQVLAKYFNIDIYSAQYIINLVNTQYWKNQFNTVLTEMKQFPIKRVIGKSTYFLKYKYSQPNHFKNKNSTKVDFIILKDKHCYNH